MPSQFGVGLPSIRSAWGLDPATQLYPRSALLAEELLQLAFVERIAQIPALGGNPSLAIAEVLFSKDLGASVEVGADVRWLR